MQRNGAHSLTFYRWMYQLDPYQVVEGEQAGILSQQVGAKLSSAQRQEDT